MTPQERLDHFVKLAMEAWSRTRGGAMQPCSDDEYHRERNAFAAAVRERLSQGVQAWALDIAADLDDVKAKAWDDAQRRAAEDRDGPPEDPHDPSRSW